MQVSGCIREVTHLIALKGDHVRTSSGICGEITEVRGAARTFFSLKLENGKSVPVMEQDVVEITKRGKGGKKANEKW